MIDPKVVNATSSGILEGSSMENVINKRSFTSGSDKKDESHIARTIKPKPPYGSNVAFNQAESVSSNDIY